MKYCNFGLLLMILYYLCALMQMPGYHQKNGFSAIENTTF